MARVAPYWNAEHYSTENAASYATTRMAMTHNVTGAHAAYTTAAMRQTNSPAISPDDATVKTPAAQLL